MLLSWGALLTIDYWAPLDFLTPIFNIAIFLTVIITISALVLMMISNVSLGYISSTADSASSEQEAAPMTTESPVEQVASEPSQEQPPQEVSGSEPIITPAEPSEPAPVIQESEPAPASEPAQEQPPEEESIQVEPDPEKTT